MICFIVALHVSPETWLPQETYTIHGQISMNNKNIIIIQAIASKHVHTEAVLGGFGEKKEDERKIPSISLLVPPPPHQQSIHINASKEKDTC